MIGPLLVTALLALSASGEDHHAQALAALAAGDLGAAWTHLDDEFDTFLRESARVRVCHEAGDLDGVLRHAQLALLERPLDLDVLFFAAWAHVSLRNGAGAAEVVERMRDAYAGAEFDRQVEQFWSGTLEGLEGEVRELRRLGEERKQKVGRARGVALALLVLAASLLGWSSLKGA